MVKIIQHPLLSEFLAKLGNVESERDGWLAHCPAHNDSAASLRITVSKTSGKVLLKCRAGCETGAIMSATGYTMTDLTHMSVDDGVVVKTTASTDELPDAPDLAALALRLDNYAVALFTPAGADALDYAARRFGIEPDDARRFGLGVATDLHGGPRLVVPFRDVAGQALGFQARALNPKAQVRWQGPPNPDGGSWAKVGYFPGSSGWHEVIVTEGPGDALTAAATGYDAIAIRGAGLVSNPSTINQLVEMLEGRVAVVAGDGDFAGREFSSRLATKLSERGITVRILAMEDGKDLTDLRAEDPAWFKQGFIKRVKATEETTSSKASLGAWDEDTYSLSDVGGARWLRDKLVAEGRQVRYTGALGFFQYQGGVWTHKDDIQMRTLAHDVGDQLGKLRRAAYEQAKASKDKVDVDRANRFAAYADRAQSSGGVDALIKELKSAAGVFASPDDFDRKPHLLAARNGVIDLRSSELLPHDPAYLLTKRIEFDYIPEAAANRWRRALEEVFPDQPEMPDFLQRLIGYGITGSTDEQVFVVNYGTGSNGKSLFTDTLTEVFRAITTTTPFSTFESKPSGGIPNDLAGLKGARMVMASEGEQNKTMAEAVLKRITGRDLISARFLHREFFEFRPQFLLMMSSNYRPAFRGQDDGLWRRVRLLEWRRQFAKDEGDKTLPDKLLAEGEGILAWAVEGARLWYAHGLDTPATITKVTSEFRTQSDVLTGFFGGVWIDATDDKAWVPRKTLYESFREYAEVENMQDLAKWSSRAFYRAVEERGYPLRRRDGVFGFLGLIPGPGAHIAVDEPAKIEVIIKDKPTHLSVPAIPKEY